MFIKSQCKPIGQLKCDNCLLISHRTEWQKRFSPKSKQLDKMVITQLFRTMESNQRHIIKWEAFFKLTIKLWAANVYGLLAFSVLLYGSSTRECQAVQNQFPCCWWRESAGDLGGSFKRDCSPLWSKQWTQMVRYLKVWGTETTIRTCCALLVL